MPGPVEGPLDGWKKIAEYFGRQVRTVQIWERDLGLPVHRLQKRVLAYPKELDAWRRKHLEVAETGPDPDVPPPAAPVRRVRPYLYVAAFIIAAGAVALARYRHSGQPSSYKISGNTLIVTDGAGAELWRYTFPDSLSENQRNLADGQPDARFADLDGDGSTSTVFRYEAQARPPGNYLICFDSRGHVRWKFTAGHSIRDDSSREYQPPFTISGFEAVRGAKSKRAEIILTSAHFWSFPDQVAVLDGPTGRLISEYWHRGHVTHMAVTDLDGDGEPEVLLGGVNDAPEYSRATMLVSITGGFPDRRASPTALFIFPRWVREPKKPSCASRGVC